MTKTLRIEVTPALAEVARCARMQSLGENATAVGVTITENQRNVIAMSAALTAAFQHPEFVRQIREQALECVPEDANRGRNQIDRFGDGRFNQCREQARASLGRLLGEEGK
jgi:hypothetical protein